MRRLSFYFLIACLSCLNLKGQKTIDTHIYGNSLVHHIVKVIPTPSDEDSSPHWMYFLARHAGHTFRLSGDFAGLPFLFSTNKIPPQNTWFLDSIPSAWNSFDTSFAMSSLDNVVITPTNFVQYRLPTQNYEFGDTFNSPVSAMDTLCRYVFANKPGIPFYIYEGWEDMVAYTGGSFPPTPAQWEAYRDSNRFGGDYHKWYLELHDSTVNRFPGECVKMIPVGPVMMEILSRAPYNTMAVDSIFEDDAPHGRPTVYFLAGMITYMAMFEEKAPAGYQPPAAFIDPVVIARYDSLVEEIWSLLMAFNYQNGTSRVFCNSPVVSTPDAVEDHVALRVYPNPVRDRLYFQTGLNRGAVVLRDMYGRSIRKVNLTDGFVDVSGLANGLYLLELQNATGDARKVEKVIVRR